MKTLNCDHIIGLLHISTDESTLVCCSEILDRARDAHKIQTRLYLFDPDHFRKPIGSPVDYIDRRRGFGNWFNYCPTCGQKIDWKKIKNDTRNSITH